MVSVVYEKKLYIAWVGDSEAAIVLNGEAEKLVEPRHVAGNEVCFLIFYGICGYRSH